MQSEPKEHQDSSRLFILIRETRNYSCVWVIVRMSIDAHRRPNCTRKGYSCPTRQIFSAETLEFGTLRHLNDDDYVFYCIHINQNNSIVFLSSNRIKLKLISLNQIDRSKFTSGKTVEMTGVSSNMNDQSETD